MASNGPLHVYVNTDVKGKYQNFHRQCHKEIQVVLTDGTISMEASLNAFGQLTVTIEDEQHKQPLHTISCDAYVGTYVIDEGYTCFYCSMDKYQAYTLNALKQAVDGKTAFLVSSFDVVKMGISQSAKQCCLSCQKDLGYLLPYERYLLLRKVIGEETVNKLHEKESQQVL